MTPRKILVSATFCAAITTGGHAAAEEHTSPECRGVAAGVVAAMRANRELATDEATTAAITAARRACMAARDDLGAVSAGDGSAAASQAVAKDEEEPSVWDILTRDRETKPGNERLKRLRQQ